jgi:DNA-binding MarR family transcriptional regulator
MKHDTLDLVTEEILTIQPFIGRSVRKKLLSSMFIDINLDISPLHVEIMMLLHREGKLNITNISEKLQIAKAQMTRYLDKLILLKLVKRKDCTNDRRITFISLTDKGNSILEEQDKNTKRLFKEILGSLTEEELIDISKSLAKLRNIFSES